MRVEPEMGTVPTLIRAGRYVVNARYLILAEQIERPGTAPLAEEQIERPGTALLVEVQMESGTRFRLVDEEAEQFWRRLLVLIPETGPGRSVGSGAAAGVDVRFRDPGADSGPPVVEPGPVVGG